MKTEVITKEKLSVQDNFRIGEIVFNTSMTGYQETLSDLSYCGQIVVMTYPLIGNYGINRDDFESLNPAIFGFIVKEACKEPNNFRSVNNLDSFLKSKGIAGIEKIDTRAITKKIREIGTIKAIMSDSLKDKDNIIKKLKNSPYANNQVKTVSTQKAYPIPNGEKKVVLIDYGAKLGIIRELSKRNCNLIVVPYNTSADEILNLNPDGIMLSNVTWKSERYSRIYRNYKKINWKTSNIWNMFRASNYKFSLRSGYYKIKIWT